LRSRKERELDWTRLVSTLKKSAPYLGPKILTLFWCTGWAWNRQIIFRFTSIHGHACFILSIKKVWDTVRNDTCTCTWKTHIFFIFSPLYFSPITYDFTFHVHILCFHWDFFHFLFHAKCEVISRLSILLNSTFRPATSVGEIRYFQRFT
jgi:hypothetical protein